ncbi:odorant receptor 74a-like isoform X2 [Eurosta solidaginis]
MSICCYLLTILGELTFMIENIDNIAKVADCLSTSFMGIQYIIRIFLHIIHRPETRNLLTNFYKYIYFTDAENAKLNKKIKLQIRYADIFTKIYYTAGIAFITLYALDVMRVGLTSPDKPFIYRMSFRWYDAQVPLPFLITALYSTWLTYSTVAIWAAEDYMLCVVLCHCSYRYKELRMNLEHLLDASRKDVNLTGEAYTNMDLHKAFRRRLYDVFRRQQQFNRFTAMAKAHFSYQIFSIMFFGVLLLCLVAFQFQRADWAKYITWLISQIIQFLLIGYFGQMLTDETTELKNSFFFCQWEDLLPLGDQHSNKLLLRDIKFALMNSQNPIVFNGMKLFPLTLAAVGSALRAGASYYMFLNTMSNV